MLAAPRQARSAKNESLSARSGAREAAILGGFGGKLINGI